jgi:EmrB/QacA subfamily drug resistance transporter
VNYAPDPRRWQALALVCVAFFMTVLDVSIVNVALPSIGDALDFSRDSLQWVITAYAIFFGGVLLLGGRLADLLGRRRLFSAGVALFAAASLLSGLAWSEASLIAFRALQGLGGALLAPAALSILTTIFREGRERNVALGIWGAASGSGGAAGVLLGGVLTSYLGWSWIFFINVPVGIAVLALAPALLPESRGEQLHRRLDVAGATAVTAGLMVLVYALTRGAEHGWATGTTIGLLAAAAALVSAFIGIELRSRSPLLPLRIFRLRTLAAANGVSVVVAAFGFSQFFLLTLYLQEVLHYSPVETGVAFAAITLTIVVFSNVAQLLVTRLGVRRVLAAGQLFAAGSFALLAQVPVDGHYLPDVFPALIVGGIGMALSFVSVTIAGLTGVGGADTGVASGLINTSRQVGGAIGLAAISTLAATTTNGYAASHRGLTAFSGAALTHGFHVAFATLVVLALVGAAAAAIFIEPQRRPERRLEEVEVVPALEEAA